jgi:hypothetical protein
MVCDQKDLAGCERATLPRPNLVLKQSSKGLGCLHEGSFSFVWMGSVLFQPQSLPFVTPAQQ